MIEKNPYINNGLAVYKASKNPERSIMLVEKLMFDETYYDLTFYGIKGVHYEVNAEGKLKLPEGLDPSENKYSGFPAHAWTNAGFDKLFAEDHPKLTEYRDELGERSVFSPIISLALNTDAIKGELGALKSVTDQYLYPLLTGVVEPEEGIAKLNEQLKAAGIEKVKAEYQKQIDAYIQSKTSK